jgi:hypothetical protein
VLRKAIFLSIAILLVAAVTVGVLYWRQLGRTGTAALFVEEGEATVRRGISTLRLASTQAYEVRSGDQIRTAADSRSLLVLSPATSVVLQSECEVVVRGLSWEETGSSVAELQLGAGETLHQVHQLPGPGSRYEVHTPAAAVRLSAGQQSVLVTDDGATRVEVFEGVATVTAQDTEVEIWPGEYSSIPVGRAPSVPQPVVARFVFVSERTGNLDIWLLDEEGRETQLTQHPAADQAPVWSPDGTRIAFETVRDGNSEIYVMDADGSNQVNLTRNSADDQAPAWSADGTLIAFESLRDGAKDLYMMRADGTEQVRLTFGPGLSFAPHWDIGGSEIVFSRIEGDSNGDGVLDLRDMAAIFSLEPGTGSPQAMWYARMIFRQTLFPWARRAV